jgi:hypothetical protein
LERNKKAFISAFFALIYYFYALLREIAKKQKQGGMKSKKRPKIGTKSLYFENVTELTRPLSDTMEKGLQRERK